MSEKKNNSQSLIQAALAEHPVLQEMYDQANGDLEEFCEALNIKVRNYDLVSEALAATPVENPHIHRFGELIDKDFTAFCDVEPALNDVVPTRKLLSIKEEMQRIANFSTLYSRRIGAVGGGFSSGKSAFVNSFLTTPGIRLAEGMKPVTAIPSYIIGSDDNGESAVQGVSYKGGVFEIANGVYSDLSHKMLKSFHFNLKDVIRYTTVFAPMPGKLFGKLCIMDTPGYNPPRTGTEKDDWDTAREYISKADFLIWLVGLDSNGTIPKSDLDFLATMDFGKEGGKPLYIVANKAELKPADDLEDILDEFEESLDDADLVGEGICAYSSKDEKRIFAFRGKDILDFLEEHNTSTNIYEHFKNELHGVFKAYIQMIHTDFDERNAKRRSVKKLLMDALESGSTSMEASSGLEDGLNDLLAYFQSPETKEARLARASELREKFLQCLKDFFDAAGIDREERRFCTGCGAPLRKRDEVCPQCSTLASGEAKRCRKCGSKLGLDANFCTDCGTATLIVDRRHQ